MTTRTRVVLAGVIGLVLAVVVAAATFPLWRPLLVDDVVDEAFPDLDADARQAVAALPVEQQEMFAEMADEDPVMAEEMMVAAAAPDAVVPEAEQAMPEMAGPGIVASGSFIEIDAVHAGSGSATVYELEDASLVLRLENFQVTNGPDLHVILTRHPDPRSRADVGEDYVDLGMLKGNVGDQNYDIPAGTTLADYQSVVIYCVPFHVVFSTATLGSA